MKKVLSYNQIKIQFKNPDWNNELISNCELKPIDRLKSIEYIIEQLNSKETSIRYISSLMIAEFQINEAKDKLIERILDEDTLNSNGTMTYALEELNCENSLVQVFKILATQSYESKCHAYNILSEQQFEFTKEDLLKMKEIFDKANSNKAKNQILDDETLAMIKDGYEGFMQYLNRAKT